MNKLEVRLWAMKRSGQHAIIEWIIAHTEGPILHVNNPLFENDNRFYHNLSKTEIAQDKQSKWVDKSLYLFNVEDGNLAKHPAMVNKNLPLRKWPVIADNVPRSLRRWNMPAKPKAHPITMRKGKSERVENILILRDPANFWASRIRVVDQQKKKPKLWFGAPALDLYRQYLNEALGHTNYLPNKVIVHFEKWNSDAEFRAQLGNRLNLTGNYKQPFEKVSKFGGGSSFGKNAQTATVNERWKIMRNDKRWKKVFQTVWSWEETKELYGAHPTVLEAVENIRA